MLQVQVLMKSAKFALQTETKLDWREWNGSLGANHSQTESGPQVPGCDCQSAAQPVASGGIDKFLVQEQNDAMQQNTKSETNSGS